VIHILPSFIFRRDDLATETAGFQTGTNQIPLYIALEVLGEPQLNTWNHVCDTAKMDVAALNEGEVSDNHSFLASSSGQHGMKYGLTLPEWRACEC
jgi:hypothetical protein